MAAADNVRSAPRTYGNWRAPASAGIAGMGTLGTAIMMFGLVITMIATLSGGITGALVSLVIVGSVLLLLMTKDKHGHSALQRLSTRIGWQRAKMARHNVYRSGPLGRTPWGKFQLPGLAAASQLSEYQDSYGRPFALLFYPSTRHFTVMINAEPDGASLVDEDQVDAWVAHWGQWLASLGHEPGIVAASVTVETAPDTGIRLRREVSQNMQDGTPAIARAMLAEVIQTYPEGSALVSARVALTFKGTDRSGKRRKEDDMGRELASRLPALTQSLNSTGAGAARPVTAQELCETIRIAYDPAAAVLIDEARSQGIAPELQWTDVGPAAAQAFWDKYRHDSAWSITWQMTQAPRGEVFSSVLSQLVGPHPDIDRKRVTLLYRPLDAATAARMVEADKRNASFRATASARPSARSIAEARAADRTAQEEARGAGLVNFGMVVTGTVMTAEQLPDMVAAIDNLGATARVLLRPAYGSQDSAFVAGLPLGIVLQSHLSVPAGLREAL
ncbi:SCO6880 family protein [Kribbella sp. ALI-6-A]|uniref:SCO6880 family protein n=1 Tax=Kribbella sp. ALI-6-A TaxID=1933817 RepID=UPI00192D0E62|nr:SCO6880 family protein [Kribbella sp. ALI-6-A]